MDAIEMDSCFKLLGLKVLIAVEEYGSSKIVKFSLDGTQILDMGFSDKLSFFIDSAFNLCSKWEYFFAFVRLLNTEAIRVISNENMLAMVKLNFAAKIQNCFELCK